MNRWKKAVAFAAVFIALAAGGTYLGLNLSKSGTKPLSTTPTCLTIKNANQLCTGVALKAISRRDIASFTSSTSVFPSIIEYYQSFGKSFSVLSAKQVAVVGARPFIQLNPHQIGMADIAAGKYDKYLNTYAQSVKSFGHTVMLSFGHEMNGTWSSWSMPFTKPPVFVAAWQHIVNVFKANHVKNVVWAWDVSHAGKRPVKLWWPGSQYVDWVGIDGYLRPGQTFAGQFWHQISYVRKMAPGKPVFIAETAVAPSSDQVKQITALFGGARERHLKALIWFNVNKKAKWQLRTNSAAAQAFRVNAEAHSVPSGVPTPVSPSHRPHDRRSRSVR